MDITAFIMGICPHHRLAWLKQTVDHLDKQNFPFTKKILSIDQFNGNTFPVAGYNYFENRGWTVMVDSVKSRSACMEKVLNTVTTDYIFYNEDDVMVDLPDYNDISEVFKTKIDDKECGMVSLTLGGCQYDVNPGNINLGDLQHINENTLLKTQDYRIFRRLEEYKSQWFFEFPGLFVKSQLFRECHTAAKNSGLQIEQGLTKGYFNLGMDQKYFKCSIAKSETLDILKEDPTKVNSHCRLLTNLDPMQGSMASGGVHTY